MISITGFKIVREFLNSPIQKVSEIYVDQESRDSLKGSLEKDARKRGVAVRSLPLEEMKHVYRGGKIKNGIVARVNDFVYQDLQKFTEGKDGDSILVMLDRIYDPQNLGAIARSAYCFGAGAIIIQDRRAPSITAAAIYASSGALAHIPVIKVVNLSKTVENLKKGGYWVYGTTTGFDGNDLEKIDFTGDVLIILGSEGEGIRKKLLEKSDRLISIPIRQDFDSLNVSVAAGIILYTVRKIREFQR